MILNAVPKGFFSWNYYIMEGTRRVAELEVAWVREQGQLTVEGASYRAFREGLMSGAFILETEGGVVARAEKPDALLRRFIIEYGDQQFTLQARSALSREFTLRDGAGEIGTIAPEGFFTRRAEVRLPAELPLPVKAFILWLVIVLWKRESHS